MTVSELALLAQWLGMVVLLFGGWASSVRLEWKYKAPYTLKNSSSRQKWRWAVQIGLLRSLMWFIVPTIALASEETFSGLLRASPAVFTIVVAIVALTVLQKRRGLDLALECYNEWDRWVKSDGRYRSDSLTTRYDRPHLKLIARLRKVKPWIPSRPLRWYGRCRKSYFYRQMMAPMLFDDKERRRFWLAGYPPDRDP